VTGVAHQEAAQTLRAMAERRLVGGARGLDELAEEIERLSLVRGHSSSFPRRLGTRFALSYSPPSLWLETLPNSSTSKAVM
jgi:hypothetical protein